MENKDTITQKEFLYLMIPFIFSAVTQPLLGAVDVAVVGRLNNANYISGVSIGALIFNTIYWVFGFLRVSTTAFSAQSIEWKSKEKASDAFFRPLFTACIISFLIIILQNIIFKGSMKFINPEIEIQKIVNIYFKILVWGAPLVLCNYVILGWLMGQGNIKGSVMMQMSSNVLNIILDIFFVTIMDLKVEGVAIATLISQGISTCLGIYFITPYKYEKFFNIRSILDKKELRKVLSGNKDLMIRTICLLMHDNMIMAASATLGGWILSTNAVLLHILEMISYSFEGLANASSVFSGRAVGRRNKELMKATWKKTIQWGIVFAVFTSGIFTLFSSSIVKMFTDIPEIISLSEKYGFWIIIFPFAGVLGLTFYGVFTGAGATFPVMVSTVGAFIAFFFSWKFIIPIYENNGIWFSLMTFYFFRGAFLVPNLKKLLKKI